MRSITTLLLTFLAVPVFGGNLWFDPPNPTSRTPVVAHLRAGTACPIGSTDVAVHGRIVSITLHTNSPCAVPPPAEGYTATVDLGVLPAAVYDVVAGPDQLLIALAEATLTVSDADAAITVTPNVALTRGDIVQITGDNLISCAAGPSPLVCGSATVTIDGVNAQIVNIRNNEITVQAPAHQPGTVDVVVQTASGTRTLVGALNYFAIDKPFDEAFFEPVLFPVMVSGPGAFGANWTTDVSMRNENDYSFPVPLLFGGACYPLIPPCEPRPFAHSTVKVASAVAPNGYLLQVPRQASNNVFFETIVRDLSRQAEAFGTEIPVVRGKDFFDRPFTMLDVPTDARYRVALRVYRLDGGTSARVAITGLTSAEVPIVDTMVLLSPAAPGATFNAGYIGDLLTTYPQLAGKGPLRILIDAGNGQHNTWGFVSATNNDTQHVSVVSPH